MNIIHETVSFILCKITWHKFRNIVICKIYFFCITSVEQNPCSFLSVTESVKSETSVKVRQSIFSKTTLDFLSTVSNSACLLERLCKKTLIWQKTSLKNIDLRRFQCCSSKTMFLAEKKS